MSDIPCENIELEPLLRLGPIEPDAARALEAGEQLPFRELGAILRRTFPFIVPQWRHLALFALVGAVNGLVQLGGTLLATDLTMNKVFLGQPLSALQAALLGLDPAQAVHVDALAEGMRIVVRNRLLSLAALLIALGWSVGLSLSYYLTWILQRINHALRTAMIERLEWMSLSYHAEAKVGDSVYRLYQDSAMVTKVLERMVIGPIVAVATILANVAVVTLFSPILGGLCLLAGAPVVVSFAAFARRLRRRSLWVRGATSDLASAIQEAFAGIRVIKAYGLGQAQLVRFCQRSRDSLQAAFELRRSFALMKMLVVFAIAGFVLALDRFTAGWALAGAPTFGAGAIAFVTFAVWNLGAFQSTHDRAQTVSGSVQELATLWGSVQDMAMGLERSLAILDLEPDIQQAVDPVPMPPLGSGVRFEGVSFSYDRARPTLSDVTLEARPGTITAIVGPTGAGKTTLLSLLLRLVDPSAGRITIGGVDLRAIALRALRDNVAIALQENLLFATTVRENIRYAVPGASDEAVAAAARVACVEDAILRLPGGFDALLGERGSKLSTGQRQRLSIARAVLKDAPVVLLDEPTASLDARTELEVLRNLAQWGKGRVIFLVTHRLSTIRSADQIAYLDGGRVIEVGSHAELMRVPGGRYRKLVEREQQAAGAPARVSA